MKSCFLLVTLWVVASSVKGQSLSPGGVKGALQWYSTDTSQNSPGLRSQLDAHNTLPVGHASMSQLNFHPSLVIDGKSPFRVDLGTGDLHNASYFTVYQSQDTAVESSIWHITNNQKTNLVLTTDRMADLSVYKYMNYRDVVRGQPKVNMYVQHKEKDSVQLTAQQWWNIGAKPLAPNLPVTAFRGLIPEVIAYDRVLNSHERLQVATYLALKYGITLTEPGATYVNSSGEIIWDGYNYSTWHHNIAGICRDDTAALNQTMACSSNSPGLLTMAARDTLSNNSFLLWGDNGKPLTPAPKVAGLPLLLQKTWLMKPSGGLHPFATTLVLNTKLVDAPLPVNPVYWLVVDPAGEGKFTSSSGFIRMDRLDADGKATFSNVSWDMDGSGKDVWGIIVARDLLLVSTINQPACSSPRTGSLQTRIIGGQSPYQLIIQNSNGLLLSRLVEDNSSPLSFTDLGTGKYSLKVTDARGTMYADSFYLNGQDAPLPAAIAASYTLSGGVPLQLNAAAGMPDGLAWQWTGPESFQSFSPQVSITAPGLYTLSCSKDGCLNEQDILVAASHDNILYDVGVYPNPSPDAFTARVTLDQPAPVTMSVYAPDGRLISSNTGYGRANYQFSSALGSGGVYQLVFVSGLSKTTKSLVIAK